MKLYKFEITAYPHDAIDRVETNEDGSTTAYLKSGWKPEGWDEYLTQCVGYGDRWAINNTEGRFFWPSQKNVYRSRSAAQEKQAIVRRWGGDARILVAEVGEFRDVNEVAAERVRARRQAKIDKLQAQIDVLELEADGEA
ncbi:hypothetical protein DWB68_15330 [Galactobacter valiniphilus]|uniref:Uncharacterized protein n=1 Tax=Galactobacter valiniphilus TaxID=2676122 RepID=A0A399JE94_9MICC|nr:hypothetical protein [Galactobacter valiniphilus]RII40936.1 hypothetical protein DWB68_15330 [Galactobacter valiniphilus]